MMRALGLDASKVATGWAVFSADGLVASGVLRCSVKRSQGVSGIESAYSGAVSEWYRTQVRALLLHWAITHVAIEEPLTSHAAAAGNNDAIHLSHTVFSAAAGACVSLNVPNWPVNQSTWRKDMGVQWPKRGAKDRTKHFKAEAMRICDWFGHAPQRHDEAEAILIARWLLQQLDPRCAVADTPLFAGKPHAERAQPWAPTTLSVSSGNSRIASRT